MKNVSYLPYRQKKFDRLNFRIILYGTFHLFVDFELMIQFEIILKLEF